MFCAQNHTHGRRPKEPGDEPRTSPRHPDHEKQVSLSEILDKAKKRALGGGLAGASAMFVQESFMQAIVDLKFEVLRLLFLLHSIQVWTLMWLRTTVNYQYRHGTTTTQALKCVPNATINSVDA